MAVAVGYSAAFMSAEERNFFRGDETGHAEMKMIFFLCHVESFAGNAEERFISKFRALPQNEIHHSSYRVFVT